MSWLQVQHLVIKYPLILNFRIESLKAWYERFRSLAYMRDTWAHEFDTMSPTLLAKLMRDRFDMDQRLEFLALSGNEPSILIRAVVRYTNNRFAHNHSGFRQWVLTRQRRKAAQEAAQRQATAQAELKQAAQAQAHALLAQQKQQQMEQLQQRRQLRKVQPGAQAAGDASLAASAPVQHRQPRRSAGLAAGAEH